MNKFMKQIVGVLGVLVMVVGVYFFGVINRETPSLGSVADNGVYSATTTDVGFFNGGTTYKVVKTGPGVLGSVVITTATAGTLSLYDATSTVTNTLWATTTLATFRASVAAGTYTFDVSFTKGLLVDYTANIASTTITWR